MDVPSPTEPVHRQAGADRSNPTEPLPLTFASAAGPKAVTGGVTARSSGRTSASRRTRRILIALALAILASGHSGLGNLGDNLTALRSPIERTAASWRGAAQVVGDIAMAAIAEEPNLGRLTGAARTPFCDDVAAEDQRPIADAINLMRRTAEGERLFRQLVDAGICVGTDEIPYNSGYAYIVKSFGSWSRSYINIATRHVRADEPDVLAALLIHEATHVDRYLNAEACTYEESCTVLANGVDLEEEIAAHAAEAEWWIQAYGKDGKRFAFGYAFGENELVKAYLRGPEAFAAYVRKIRSDPREATQPSD